MKESALLSIREFSKLTGVPQSTLRYYDEIGLLPPETRGENNYRYYTPYQFILLNFINVLVDLGVPLATIKEMNTERTPEKIINLLSRQETKLNQKLHELQTAYSIIHTLRDNISTGLFADENNISVQDIDETYLVFGPKNDWENKVSFYKPFMNFYNSAESYRINIRYPIGGYHSDMHAFLNAPGKPDRFFSLDPFGNYKRVSGKYLVGYTRGYYGEFGDIAEKMVAYAKEHELKFSGPVFSVYPLDEISTIDRQQYLSQVLVRVSPDKK